MAILLPTSDELYEALLARDMSYEGRLFVGVTSTGVFCRLSCVARKPRRENCEFYNSPADCISAKFRPCARCRPLDPLGRAHPVVADLLDAIEREPSVRWTERAIQSRGLDPSTVRRLFKRQLGTTFLDLARRHRLKQAVSALAEGQSVIEAQLEGGFESAGGFRSAFTALLGRAPGLTCSTSELVAAPVASPLGPLLAITDRTSLHLLEFFDRKALPSELKRLQLRARLAIGIGRTRVTDQIEQELGDYFSGQSTFFLTPLAPGTGSFNRLVWESLCEIPVGETRSYGQIASSLGRGQCPRAVARSCGANQISILIPCHRVVGADGDLTGYGGGLWRKRWLLDHERSLAKAVQAHASN